MHEDDAPADDVGTDIGEVDGGSEESQAEKSRISTLEDIRELSPGNGIRIWRTWPLFARGYLTELEVPEDGMSSILEVVRTTWGGGKYRLQHTVTDSRGSKVYGKGAVTFQVAGATKMNGREYTQDGVLMASSAPSAPGVSQPSVVVQSPAPAQNAGMEQMLGLVQTALQSAVNGGSSGGPVDLGGIVSAVKEMREMVPSPQEPLDAFGQMERAMAMMARIQKMQAPPAQDDEGGGLFGGGSGGMMEQMLLAKIMGGMDSGPRPQPQQHYGHGGHPYNQPPPPRYQQPTHPQHPQHPHYPPPPAPPYVHPQHAQQPYQAPQQPPPQQQPPQPPPPQPPPQAAQTVSTPSEPDEGGSEDEYEPITPTDVVDQIHALGEAEQMQFLSSLLEGLGLPGGLSGVMGKINGSAASGGVNLPDAFNLAPPTGPTQ